MFHIRIISNSTRNPRGKQRSIIIVYFPKDIPKYIGLKFKINDVYHCIYIAVKTNYNGERFELLNYGYEKDNQICIATPDFTMDLNEQSLASNISVFPNPSSNQFTIDLGSDFNSSKISLTTLQGKTVFPLQYFSSSHFNLDIVNQLIGIYLLHIESEGGKMVIRLVKN